MHSPRENYFTAAFRVLRYLKKNPNQGIFLSISPSFSVSAFCDVDWECCHDPRRCISGLFIFIGGSPISWKSKKQASISLFSAEVEYHFVRRLVAELTWLTCLLFDLSVPPTLLILIRFDNQARIQIEKNLVFHERTKHMKLDCHFVRQQYLSGLISLIFVPSKDQVANVFTKSLMDLLIIGSLTRWVSLPSPPSWGRGGE